MGSAATWPIPYKEIVAGWREEHAIDQHGQPIRHTSLEYILFRVPYSFASSCSKYGDVHGGFKHAGTCTVEARRATSSLASKRGYAASLAVLMLTASYSGACSA